MFLFYLHNHSNFKIILTTCGSPLVSTIYLSLLIIITTITLLMNILNLRQLYYPCKLLSFKYKSSCNLLCEPLEFLARVWKEKEKKRLSRFVLNVPKEDLQSFERILFLVEYAHWFYEDNSVENNPSLKSLSLKEFTSLMFNSCDVLKPYVAHIDDIFKDFTSYKVRVPVTGAIILNETFERCLLVKGWKGSSWSFPRGKKSKDEEDHACAVREVLEETGFDVSKFLNKDEYLEVIFGQQRVRLYIIAGVKDDTSFAPQTKKEISEIAWQRLDELQPSSDEVISRGITGLKLYMVSPFLASLKSWISTHRSPMAPRPDLPLKGICVWKAKHSSTGSSSTIMDSQPTKSEPDSQPIDVGPGRSLRNFRFSTAPILQAMEASFS